MIPGFPTRLIWTNIINTLERRHQLGKTRADYPRLLAHVMFSENILSISSATSHHPVAPIISSCTAKSWKGARVVPSLAMCKTEAADRPVMYNNKTSLPTLTHGVPTLKRASLDRWSMVITRDTKQMKRPNTSNPIREFARCMWPNQCNSRT